MREGSWGASFVEALAPRPGADAVITHNRVNAFYSSGLEAALSALKATHLVLMGVATHSVVEHTARHAADMGFTVTIVEDACSAWPRERHTASLAAIDNLVTLRSAAELAHDWH